MKTTVLLALAALLALPASSATAPGSAIPRAPVQAAAGPDEEMALLADFVEIGRVDRSVPRGVAIVELLNLSPHVLDVVVGNGSTSLQPKDRLIARVEAGDRDVTVTSREKGVDAMEGRLKLEDGIRYELALAFGAVPRLVAEFAPGLDPGPAADAPAVEAGRAPGEAARAPPPPRHTRGGKVDMGRRRR